MPKKFTWPLNHRYKVYVTKHQRHVIRKRRKRKSICGRQNCQQTKKRKLSSHKRRWDDASVLSARTTGGAGLSTVWPNTGGGPGTRRGLRRPGTCLARSEASASSHRLTDSRHTSSRLLLVSELTSDWLVQSTPAESIPFQLNRL